MYALKPLLHKRQKVYRQGDLRTIAFDVTSRCNMTCSHCYAQTFAKAKPLELGILKKVCRQAYALGVHHYILQGGEPIVDPHRLEAVVQLMFPSETYLNVVSNGWLMSRDKIRWLKDLQVDKICLSLDSGIREEHDANRCPGSYDRVLQAIDDVQAEGLLCSISTVVTHQTLHGSGVQKAIKVAMERDIRIDMQIAMPVGKWDGQKEILITPEDAAYIRKLRDKMPDLSNGQRRINRDVFNYGGDDHCPAGVEFMAISTDGNILPCNFCQYTIGNVREVSLAKVRKRLIRSRWFNGKNPDCLLGENDEFFNLYVKPNVGKKKPLDAFELFDI